MNKLIYETSLEEHYKSTLYMNYIKTKDKNLNFDKTYTTNTVSCTSEVRRTEENWFYILQYGVDRIKFQSWLNEFVHLFPTLEIELLPDDTFSNLKLSSSVIGSGSHLPMCFCNQQTGNIISIEVKHKTKGTIFIGKNIIFQNILTNIPELSKVRDDYKDIIIKYVNANHTTLVKPTNYHSLLLFKSKTGLFDQSCYFNDLDLQSLTKEKVINYITELYENNILYVTNFKNKDKNRLVLKVLHSKKAYQVESYLLHHLIRAGLSQELQIFVNQYYRIKELMPDLFFWNKVFLAQMGLKMHAYWWFTGERFFKLTTEKKFFKFAKNFEDDSANRFFDHFKHKYNVEITNKIVELYKNEQLEELCRYISETLMVELIPAKKERFVNLGLKNDYTVNHEEGDYYFIAGDDLIVRRYKKSNFNLLTI